MAIIRLQELSLGELEVAVCNALWERGEADVRTMHQLLGVARGISSNTVQSALDRLFRKGILSRVKVGNAFLYQPQMSREQFASRVLDSVADALGGAGQQPLMSAFLDRAERVDPEVLDRLEAMIARRRQREKDSA